MRSSEAQMSDNGFTKKTIDQYIRNRIKYWIYHLGAKAPEFLKEELSLSTSVREDLTDDDKQKIGNFQRSVRDNVIVTGGCFTSMVMGEIPNDIDLYVKHNSTAIKVITFYLNKMKIDGNLQETRHVHQIEAKETNEGVWITIRSQGVTSEQIDNSEYEYFEMQPEEAADLFFAEYRKNVSKKLLEDGNSYNVAFMTSNAISLTGGIQLITRFTGEVEEIHSNFDFIHATNYWTWKEGVVFNTEALQATLEKRLYYFGSKFPVATLFRVRKFVERGWRINAGELLKIAYDISHLDLDNVNVLREQSIGMDSAYFNEVIAILSKRSDKKIDRTYLFNAIEIAFNMIDTSDSFLEASSGDYDDIVSQEDIDSLNDHVQSHFGDVPTDGVMIAGPAW